MSGQFTHQLAQIRLRHLLGPDVMAYEARPGEMLFRAQKISVGDDDEVTAVDELTIDLYAMAGAFGDPGELLAQNRAPLRSVDLDVRDEDNAPTNWAGDERFDIAADRDESRSRRAERVVQSTGAVDCPFSRGRPTDHATTRKQTSALGMTHRTRRRGKFAAQRPVQSRRSHLERMERLLCLFELTVADPGAVRAGIAGCPVYLGMARDHEQRLRLKPQNLLLNLPLARAQ
jgi:hypothetical protein